MASKCSYLCVYSSRTQVAEMKRINRSSPFWFICAIASKNYCMIWFDIVKFWREEKSVYKNKNEMLFKYARIDGIDVYLFTCLQYDHDQTNNQTLSTVSSIVHIFHSWFLFKFFPWDSQENKVITLYVRKSRQIGQK